MNKAINKKMKQIQKEQQFHVKINEQFIEGPKQIPLMNQSKRGVNDLDRQLSLTQPRQINSSIPSHNRRCVPILFKREVLRIIFIPLLIVLFLLTIALTFKQNNYQTNDYFYSKNIQINRKIRGVVPPLNQTKENIFGEYQIGLVQSFSVEDRRMFEEFRVELWRNQSMRISETGKEGQCWGVYKLKFYSSTIFIERMEGMEGKQNEVNSMQQALDNTQTVNNSTLNTKETTNSSQASPQPATNKTTSSPSPSNATTTSSTSNSSNHQKPSSTETSTSEQKSTCQVDKWSKLHQILGNSHIWTFAEGNFYLLEFSQMGDGGNGVLIMKMNKQYPNNI